MVSVDHFRQSETRQYPFGYASGQIEIFPFARVALRHQDIALTFQDVSDRECPKRYHPRSQERFPED